MKKLFELKNWMTVEDAALHLGGIFKEDVSEADVLQLAIDGHLSLSLDLVNHAKARLGSRVSVKEADLKVLPAINLNRDDDSAYAEALNRLSSELSAGASREEKLSFIERNKQLFESGYLLAFYSGTELSDGTVISFTEEVVTISGLWDIPMIASEQIEINHRLQQLIEGPSVDLTDLDGTFLVSADGKTYASLQGLINLDGPRTPMPGMSPAYNNPHDYYPLGAFPDDANLVVRVENIRNFTRSLDDSSKPLDERERITLLNIIGALAEEAGLDLSQHNKAGNAVAAMLDQKGIVISGRAIGDHLRKVREAMESRIAR